MKGLVIQEGKLRFKGNLPRPFPSDEALIKVRLAGICKTDLEISQGYMGFSGILGHEFTGEVITSPEKEWTGKRVVGEINCGCGQCELCKQGLKRHCPNRTVLGILGRDGCLAEYLRLPLENLHPIPDHLGDQEAVFTEPVAAACRIAEQIKVENKEILVIGDGKLGLLISQVLKALGGQVLARGKHPEKLAVLENRGIEVITIDRPLNRKFEIVVEASGSGSSFTEAAGWVKPLGTLVLKTTIAHPFPFQPAPLVIGEIRVIGSRCGPFAPALKLLSEKRIEVTSMIDSCFPLSQGMEAFQRARTKGVLKVLVRP